MEFIRRPLGGYSTRPDWCHIGLSIRSYKKTLINIFIVPLIHKNTFHATTQHG